MRYLAYAVMYVLLGSAFIVASCQYVVPHLMELWTAPRISPSESPVTVSHRVAIAGLVIAYIAITFWFGKRASQNFDRFLAWRAQSANPKHRA